MKCNHFNSKQQFSLSLKLHASEQTPIYSVYFNVRTRYNAQSVAHVMPNKMVSKNFEASSVFSVLKMKNASHSYQRFEDYLKRWKKVSGEHGIKLG